jgi:hypothetical protein
MARVDDEIQPVDLSRLDRGARQMLRYVINPD